ncbi:MAG TPA: zf-HC2 domain-containing protein [Ktedonobacterales bacterium]|jgi:anti-sigma factor RsiW
MALEPQLTCKELVELVTDYLDDALTPLDRARFDAHLAICPGCQTYLDQMQTTIHTLGSLPEESLTSEARDQLLAAFRQWKDRDPVE